MAKNSDPWGLPDLRGLGNTSLIGIWDPNQMTKTYNKTTGALIDQQNAGFGLYSSRPSYSKTRIQKIPGTSTPWRPPTAYSRYVYIQDTWQTADYTGPIWNTKTALKTVEFINSLNTAGAKVTIPNAYFMHNTASPGVDNPDVGNAVTRAEVECLLKLKDQKFDAGTFLAEAMKTASHLAHTAVDLYGTFVAMKHGEWNKLLNILSKRSPLHRRKVTVGKTAAQYWLEYNYAWKPLIGEVYGLYELLRERVSPALLLHANRTIRVDTEGANIGSPTYGIRYEAQAKLRRQVTVRLTAELEASAIRYLARAGLINPLAVAWEVVPYSFVVDWAVPVGNVLQALDATNGLRFVGGSRTIRSRLDSYVRFSSKTGSTQEGRAEVHKFDLKRTVYGSFPRPALYAKSPFSTSHLASAIALVRQLF